MVFPRQIPIRRTEELDGADLSDDVLGKDLVAGDSLDLDLAVRHFRMQMLAVLGWESWVKFVVEG